MFFFSGWTLKRLRVPLLVWSWAWEMLTNCIRNFNPLLYDRIYWLKNTWKVASGRKLLVSPFKPIVIVTLAYLTRDRTETDPNDANCGGVCHDFHHGRDSYVGLWRPVRAGIGNILPICASTERTEPLRYCEEKGSVPNVVSLCTWGYRDVACSESSDFQLPNLALHFWQKKSQSFMLIIYKLPVTVN